VVWATACSDGDDDTNGEPTASESAAPGTSSPSSGDPTAPPTAAAPDQLIVYEGRNATSTNVFTINASTGESTQLTFDEATSGHPAWTTDYTRIIFTSNRNGLPKRNLWTMAPDGSDIQQLTNDPLAHHWSAKYSPDMTQIVYVEVTEDEGSFLTLMNADGTNARRLTESYNFMEFPAWTRDGAEIYFAAISTTRNNIDLYAFDLATSQTRVIVQTNAPDVCPHFSRDGSRMTYASMAEGETNNMDLFAREAPFDSGPGLENDLRLTHDPLFDDYSNASPDDGSYVYLSRRDGNTELYLMDRDGENERRLTTTPDLEENVPDW
jgi:Tol biopolymer transport system component